MENSLKLQPEKQLSPWRVLYHPMLVISLILHGLALAIPTPSDSEPVAEVEDEKVEILELTPLLPTSPQPSASSAPSPSPQAVQTPPPAAPAPAAPPAAAPPAPRPPRVNPISELNPAPPPAAAVLPEVASTPATSPLPEATPPITENPQQFQNFLGQFQSDLGGLQTVEGLGIPYYLFPQPELFFTSESIAESESTGAEPMQVTGVENVLWASRRRPDELYDQLQTLFAGFTFSDQGEFGGGKLYEVKKEDTVRYINLVRATDRTATFVVVWNRNPNVPAEQVPANSSLVNSPPNGDRRTN